MGCSFSRTALAWVSSMGAVLQEHMAPVWVPCRVISSARKPAAAWGPPSPQIHRSCQEPDPAWALHEVTASFRHPPALVWGPSWAAGGYLLHCGPPWAAGAQLASPWSLPWAAGEPLLWHLEHLLLLLLYRPCCLQSSFSRIFLLLFPAVSAIMQGFFPS